MRVHTRGQQSRFTWCLAVACIATQAALAVDSADAPACKQLSELEDGWCFLDAGAGVEVHYQLVGTPATSIDMLVRAQATGYVGIAFTQLDNKYMTPADAVIGWYTDGCEGADCWSLNAYRLDSQLLSGIVADPSLVPLSNTSVQQSADGWTSMRFSRPLAGGRYPIDITNAATAVSINVAHSSRDQLGIHDAFAHYKGFLSEAGVASDTSNAAAAAPKCAASPLLDNGCVLDSGAGVQVHYRVQPSSMDMIVQAETTGTVGIAFKQPGNKGLFPADAVMGWKADCTDATAVNCAVVDTFLLDGDGASGVQADYRTWLTKVDVQEADGRTAIHFTRPLQSGRFPIDPSQPTYISVARASKDGVADWDELASAAVTFLTADVTPLGSPKRSSHDALWVAHGVLMILAWLLLAPHGGLIARFKPQWDGLLSRSRAWSLLHRAVLILSTCLHVIAFAIAVAKFGGHSDSVYTSHKVIGILVTALLGLHLLLAVLPVAEDSPRYKAWQHSHMSLGYLTVLLAIVDCCTGVYLYDRKPGGLSMPTGGWVGLLVACAATVAAHAAWGLLQGPKARKPESHVSDSEHTSMEDGKPENRSPPASSDVALPPPPPSVTQTADSEAVKLDIDQGQPAVAPPAGQP